eukprot:g6773.t1
MHRVSASASRSLPSQDLRRYSYKLSYPVDNDGKRASRATNACRCALPERPDDWSDKMWRKYLAMMARLPCKVCKTEPVVYAPPARSSVAPQGGSTTPSIMKLLSKGKKHYKERKKDSKSRDRDEADAQGVKKEEEEQQQQQQQQQQEKPHEGEGVAPPAEGLCSTPFCATNTPSSVVEATSAAAAVFPRRKKGAAPWDEEGE